MPSFATEIYSRKHEEENELFTFHNKENNIFIPNNNDTTNMLEEYCDESPIKLLESDRSDLASIIIENDDWWVTSNKNHQLKRTNDILKNRKWYTWIFPFIASLLILWTILGYPFGFLLPIILSSNTSTGGVILHVIYLVLFTIMATCIVYSFVKCTFTNPGFVFKDDKLWKLTLEQVKQYKKRGPGFIADLEKEIKEIMSYRDERREFQNDSTTTEVIEKNEEDIDLNFNDSQTSELNSRGKMRICEKCWVRKPDRAHHCRQLNCCVLKMDHFCPWFNNCIGYYNHKYFFTFLAWIAITGFFIVTTMSKTMFKTLQHSSQNSFSFSTFNSLWIYILSFCFGFSMFFFAGYHFKLILFNTTTIESLDKERRLLQQHQCHPYDVGVLKNIKSVLGNNPVWWLSPFHVNYEGDGCHFPIKTNNYEILVN